MPRSSQQRTADLLLQICENQRYFGRVQLIFRAGELVHLEFNQTVKPEELASAFQHLLTPNVQKKDSL